MRCFGNGEDRSQQIELQLTEGYPMRNKVTTMYLVLLDLQKKWVLRMIQKHHKELVIWFLDLVTMKNVNIFFFTQEK